MSYPYRCSHCRARHSMPVKVHNHTTPCTSPSCPGKYVLDSYRLRKEKQTTCWCSGYMFPHRKGSYYCESYSGTYSDYELEHDRELQYRMIPT